MFICSMINHFPQKGLRMLLPGLSYSYSCGMENSILGAWISEKLENLFPVFTYPGNQQLIAHRKDSFEVSKIQPVELLTMMEFENYENIDETEATQVPSSTTTPVPQQPAVLPEATQIPEMVQIQETMATTFVPHTLQTIVNIQELADYDTLIKNFYTIDSVAMIGSDLLNAEALNSMDLRIVKKSEEPQILIYHTHSQEAFTDSVPGDDSTTIVGVGEHLAEILRNQYGYNVIHHLGEYDAETRDNAYSRALPEIEQILADNPSIQVVIDLHRDAMPEEKRLVMDLDGKPTARFMFFNGVSCGRKTGNIDYLYNPNLTENMAFSFQLKKAAEEYYPGLTRKNYINAYRYNMHLCGRTTLLELGAQNNTVEEVMNACDPIAHILDMVLTGA